MPRYCCVPNCTSNRPGKEYVTCFRFPKDFTLNELWKKKIPRDFEVKHDSVVCEKHFLESDIIKCETFTLKDGSTINQARKIPKLKDEAYPRIFPDCPYYLSDLPSQRTATLERKEKMRKLDDQEMNEWLKRDKIYSLTTVIEELTKTKSNIFPFVLGGDILFHYCDDCVSFLFISCAPFPKLVKSITIDKNLLMSFSFNDKLYNNEAFTNLFKTACRLDFWSQLENVLNFAKCFTGEVNKCMKTSFDESLKQWDSFMENECSSDKMDSAKFIKEQMLLLNKPLHGRRYSTDLIIFSYIIYIKSTAVYKYLCTSNIIFVPSLRHLRRLSSNIKVTPGIATSENLSFLQGRCNSLSEKERIVNLLIDEIYIKPCVSFKNQTVSGFTKNTKIHATTIQAFMISSVLSNVKEIVSLVPVFNLTAVELYDMSLKVLQMLEHIGFTVLTIISDNNRVNRNMFQKLSGGKELKITISNPFNCSKNVFLLFDSVHIIKSIRNNWINQKDNEQKFVFPNPKLYFEQPKENNSGESEELETCNTTACASFSLLRTIYQEESCSIIKLAPKLTLKSLKPNNFEKQNVSLALKVFNVSNVSALNIYKEKESCNPEFIEQTACFIDKIITWWEIINVKTPYKGQRLRLPCSEPVTYKNQYILEFLQSFVSWVNAWENMKQKKRGGGLSCDTFTSLSHSTLCMILICKYLLNDLKLDYVLCGKFQTDNLEARFGQYRQMSGSNYYISVQEILEAEKKLRIKSLLIVKSAKYGNFSIHDLISSHCFEDDSSLDVEVDKFLSTLDNLVIDFENLSKNDIKVLSYIGGYCVHKLKITCENCIQNLITMKDMVLDEQSFEHLQYLHMLDRGGLKIPSSDIIIILCICYEIFMLLVSDKYECNFLNCKNQVNLLVKLTILSLEEYDIINLEDICSYCNNTHEFYILKVLRTFSNICLNNYVKQSNNAPKIKQSTNRKLKKFQT